MFSFRKILEKEKKYKENNFLVFDFIIKKNVKQS